MTKDAQFALRRGLSHTLLLSFLSPSFIELQCPMPIVAIFVFVQ